MPKIFSVTSDSSSTANAVDTNAAGSAKYVLALTGHASAKASILGIDVGFSGIAAADKPYVVQIVRCDNTPAASTDRSGSIVALDSQVSQSALCTAAEDFTAFGGGTVVVLWQTTVHPQTRMSWSPPFGTELPVNSASETVAIKVITQTGGTGTIDTYATITWRE